MVATNAARLNKDMIPKYNRTTVDNPTIVAHAGLLSLPAAIKAFAGRISASTNANSAQAASANVTRLSS